jgi:hypothetical protein
MTGAVMDERRLQDRAENLVYLDEDPDCTALQRTQLWLGRKRRRYLRISIDGWIDEMKDMDVREMFPGI